MLIETHYPNGELETATPLRRLGGFVLDRLLFVLTLGIGWLIWSAVVWQRGQSPGKQLLRMYIIQQDGTRAGGWYTFLREIIVKVLVVSFLSVITLGLFHIIGALWCTWDAERQTLWDKMVGTYIAYSPSRFMPETAAEQRLRGARPSESALIT
jgi:uncharacterized RDD family membrane protein YckC